MMGMEMIMAGRIKLGKYIVLLIKLPVHSISRARYATPDAIPLFQHTKHQQLNLLP
jgi:hypothetical protein